MYIKAGLFGHIVFYKKQPIKHLSPQGIHGRMNRSQIYKFKDQSSGEDPVFSQNPGSEALYLERRKIFKFLLDEYFK